MQKRKVLVCGATGFIGRAVAAALCRHDDLIVSGTGRRTLNAPAPNCRMVQADLTSRADVSRATQGKDIIIQAAAVSGGLGAVSAQPARYIADNMVMNSYLAEAALANQAKQFIFMSCSVLYPPYLVRPVCEDDIATDAIHPAYRGGAWVKLAMEQLCAYYATLGQTSYLMVRHANIYGPQDHFNPQRSHVFAATLQKVLTAEKQITLWGDGRETRDWLCVDDLIDFFNRLIDCPAEPYQVYNVGSGQAVSVNQLARQMIELAGRPLDITYDCTRPQIDCRITLDCSRAAAKLGWRPQTELTAGILKTINWYRAKQKEAVNVTTS